MNYPIVHVVWHDAFSKDSWKSIPELRELPSGHATIDTVGFLVRKDKKLVVIANSISREDHEYEDEACCSLCIPRGMVVSMKVLVKKCARSKR